MIDIDVRLSNAQARKLRDLTKNTPDLEWLAVEISEQLEEKRPGPFREVTQREQSLYYVRETLSCGHIVNLPITRNRYPDEANRRRCKECKL